MVLILYAFAADDVADDIADADDVTASDADVAAATDVTDVADADVAADTLC